MGAVSDVVDSVSNVVGGAIDTVSNLGSTIDDAVNNYIPGGWWTAGALATGGALGGADLLGSAALDEAATNAALDVASTDAMAGWGGAGLTDAAALENATGIAGAADGASSFGINPSSTSSWGLSTTPTATGIDTTALNSQPWIGGAGTLDVGTAGLTADQIANAGVIGNVGSNASSGLGYLGGSESLPSGTAGITGVTSTPFLDSITNTFSNVTPSVGQGLSGGNTAYLLAKGLTGGNQSTQIGYNMNKNPFSFPTQQSIQGSNTTSALPQELQQQNQMASLANLLRK